MMLFDPVHFPGQGRYWPMMLFLFIFQIREGIDL